MERDVKALSASERFRWNELDRARFDFERSCLRPSWEFSTFEDRFAWEGTVSKVWKGRSAPEQKVRLIYPFGFPARFLEARLIPDLPKAAWGAWGSHVNSDGSACYVTADEWSPQDTAVEAARLLANWWWNYFWVHESKFEVSWPERGLAEV